MMTTTSDRPVIHHTGYGAWKPTWQEAEGPVPIRDDEHLRHRTDRARWLWECTEAQVIVLQARASMLWDAITQVPSANPEHRKADKAELARLRRLAARKAAEAERLKAEFWAM